jgi:prepilin-type N-terminal cleavage/methylation domain-containing protein
MRSHQWDPQRGASLVEVLVAMVILAVGLLGLVGLQARLHVL